MTKLAFTDTYDRRQAAFDWKYNTGRTRRRSATINDLRVLARRVGLTAQMRLNQRRRTLERMINTVVLVIKERYEREQDELTDRIFQEMTVAQMREYIEKHFGDPQYFAPPQDRDDWCALLFELILLHDQHLPYP